MVRSISFPLLFSLVVSSAGAQNIGVGTNTPIDKLTVLTGPNLYGITHTDGTIRVSTFVGGGLGGGWVGTQSNHAFHLFTNNNVVPNLSLSPGYFNDFKGTKPWTRWFDGNNESGSVRANADNLEIAASKSSLLVVPPGNLILQADDISQFGNQFAGNIGIGTRTPADKVTLYYTGYGFTHTDGAVTLGTWVGNSAGYFGTKSNHPLRFFTNNGSAQMSLLPNGNVGIGTSNPTFRLSVNGVIQSKEVVVETGWADYVFADDYALRPLSEVRSFISQHRHLPNIPSAREIEENGLRIGDVQKRMMEKIEELTLYLLEADNKIRQLSKEIDQLKKAKQLRQYSRQ